MLIRPDMTLAEELDALEAAAPNILVRRKPRRLPRPPKGAPVPSEDQVQISIVNLVTRLGGKAVAVENETKKRLSDVQMFARKRRGVVGGTSDLFTFWPRAICVIVEVKKPGGSVEPEQDDFIDARIAQGFVAGVAASVDEAMDLFRRAGVIR